MSIRDRISKIFGGKTRRHFILLTFDVLCFIAVDLFYLLLNLKTGIIKGNKELNTFFIVAAIQIAYTYLFRTVFATYRNVWRYTNTKAYLLLIVSDFCGTIFTIITTLIASIWAPLMQLGLWQGIVVGSVNVLITLMSRFCYAVLYKRLTNTSVNKVRLPVAIVGAGRLATYLAGDLRHNSHSDYMPLFYIDNDTSKIGKSVAGLKVYDYETARQKIAEYNIHTVIIAITNTTSEKLRMLYNEYSGLGCKVRIFESLVTDENSTRRNQLRDFTIEDLLFRKPIDINGTKSLNFYKDKVVLVTGGGGSIGSELCRKIAACSPKELIIFDIYENNAYDIQQELIRKYNGKLNLKVEIGSVRDRVRLEHIFSSYRPEIVFHAAAHKHVPLMEVSASEAIKNNCIGTYNTADMAEKYGVSKFIFISTDKAVNPTNVMGASKRICEMIIQCRTDSKTSFSAVRFGNVLGSNGSVIPLFKRQIEEGGPITLTDKRIIRYFMTIPEAAQLVIESGAMAKHGDLFVLDMGKPVRIYDLALNMIQIMGLTPYVDIDIKEIGLRPGEKLYEELLMKTENLDKTDNNLIFIERDTPYTRAQVDEKMKILKEAVDNLTSADCSLVKEAVKKVVPTFHVPEELNKKASESEEMKSVSASEKANSENKKTTDPEGEKGQVVA